MAKDDPGGRFRKKRTNFSMISNEAIHDERLSLKAKGLYALIQSYITIEGFDLYKSFLLSRCKEGAKAFGSAWSELKDVGYLVPYRIQDPKTKHFFWEFDLLDYVEPESQDGGAGDLDPQSHGAESALEPYPPPNGVHGSGAIPPKGSIWQKGSSNNILEKNTVSDITSNPIASINDVQTQINYETFDGASRRQINDIVFLIADTLNMPDDAYVRINQTNIRAKNVKERFRVLDKSHIEYVLETLSRQTGIIGNMRAYLLTSLYNAPATIDSFYQNWVNHDLYSR